MFRAALALVVAAALTAAPARADLRFQFDDSFSEAERAKLKLWVSDVAAGVENLVGPYPFDVRIRFERARSAEPVPWAHTLRGRTQGVRFYVDPSYSIDELRADWTAPHEMSHLILPYLGRSNGWFAEGFASFMQYQVMHAMGVLGEEAVTGRYLERLGKAERAYNYPERPFVEAAPRLRAERKYPTMYWGGSVYFMRINDALERESGTDIITLLREYLHCCRRNSATLRELLDQLDDLTGSSPFADELADFVSTRGFPSYEGIKPRAVRAATSAE